MIQNGTRLVTPRYLLQEGLYRSHTLRLLGRLREKVVTLPMLDPHQEVNCTNMIQASQRTAPTQARIMQDPSQPIQHDR
jgi:hypothetical protein